MNNDPDRWADMYGYLSKGDKNLSKGDENVMVFGVVMKKYVWEDDGKKYERPLVQSIGVERLDIPTVKLASGAKGNAVKALQTRLKELGYLSGLSMVDTVRGRSNA